MTKQIFLFQISFKRKYEEIESYMKLFKFIITFQKYNNNLFTINVFNLKQIKTLKKRKDFFYKFEICYKNK